VGRKNTNTFKMIMSLSVSKIKNFLLLSLLFVLPWQTRLIYQSAFIGNNFWEYGSLSLYGTEILLGLTVLLFLIEKLRGNFQELFVKHLNKKRLTIILASFFGVLALYLFSSQNQAVTWQYLNWFIYGICLIFILLESEIKFRKLLLCVWSGGVIQAVIAIWQFFIQYIPANKWFGMALQDPHQLGVAVIEFGQERWLRAYGAFGWPNSLGIYLATVFVMGLILVGSLENKKIKTVILVGQIIVLAGLFFTFARGAWLATMVGVVVVGLKKYKENNFWQQIGIYSLTFLMLLVIFKPLVFSRINFQNRLEKMSLSQRANQLDEFQQVLATNYLLGAGPGSYTTALYNLHPKYFVGDLKPVHNIFLLFVAEWGIVGLVFLIIFLSYSKKIINWSFAPLSTLLVAGFFDHWNLTTFTGLIFLCLVVGFSIKYSGIDIKSSQG